MDISDKKNVDYQTKRFCFEMLIFPTYSPFLSNQPKNHHQSNHKHPPTSRGKLRVQTGLSAGESASQRSRCIVPVPLLDRV